MIDYPVRTVEQYEAAGEEIPEDARSTVYKAKLEENLRREVGLMMLCEGLPFLPRFYDMYLDQEEGAVRVKSNESREALR
jgi:hypothetical protein